MQTNLFTWLLFDVLECVVIQALDDSMGSTAMRYVISGSNRRVATDADQRSSRVECRNRALLNNRGERCAIGAGCKSDGYVVRVGSRIAMLATHPLDKLNCGYGHVFCATIVVGGTHVCTTVI